MVGGVKPMQKTLNGRIASTNTTSTSSETLSATRRDFLRAVSGMGSATAGLSLFSSDAAAHPDISSNYTNIKWRNRSAEELFDILKHRHHITDDPALQVELSEGAHYGDAMVFRTQRHWGTYPEAMHLRWQIRLPEGFTVDQQVKLHAICGRGDAHDDWAAGGWGGRISDGSNGWSARIALDDSQFADQPGLEFYIYHADMSGDWGDHYPWGTPLTPGIWHVLDLYVEVNTPGLADGTVAGWIDGELGLALPHMRFRDANHEHIAIDQWWHNIYHGGVETSPKDQHVRLSRHDVGGITDRTAASELRSQVNSELTTDRGYDRDPMSII